MKRYLLFLCGLIISTYMLAQAPQGISHQAVMRDIENNLIVESLIGLKVSILQGAHDGVAVYVETHQVTSNQNGLITYIIGNGDVVAGVFEDINWGSGAYWLKTEADPDGGTNYSISGVTRFLSVPYALHAKAAETAQTAAVAESFITKPPKAIATEAIKIGASSAMIRGIVNGEGFSTVVVFEWGTTTAYGNTITAVQSPVTGSNDVALHALLSGLQAATTYHFRIRATNAVDVTNSNGIIFTTAASAMYSLNLSVQPKGSGTVTGAGEYPEGETAEISGVAAEGWVFVGWSGDIDYIDDTSSPVTTVTMPGYSISLTANFAEEEPGFSCHENITFTYSGEEVTYGTVVRVGLCWMDRNLGASRVPTSMTDSQGYGDLFQWGRLDDGHQDRTSSTTPGPVNQDVPGHGNFITVGSSPYNWRSPQNNELWQGEDGINNPCPEGWRVPTEAELNAERQSWGSNNSAGAYASTLKWPVGGYRTNDGTLNFVGSHGVVWSSSVSGPDACYLLFGSGGASLGSGSRANGMSVRCVRDL